MRCCFVRYILCLLRYICIQWEFVLLVNMGLAVASFEICIDNGRSFSLLLLFVAMRTIFFLYILVACDIISQSTGNEICFFHGSEVYVGR